MKGNIEDSYFRVRQQKQSGSNSSLGQGGSIEGKSKTRNIRISSENPFCEFNILKKISPEGHQNSVYLIEKIKRRGSCCIESNQEELAQKFILKSYPIIQIEELNGVPDILLEAEVESFMELAMEKYPDLQKKIKEVTMVHYKKELEVMDRLLLDESNTISKLYASYERPFRNYLLYEYCEGIPLGKLIESKKGQLKIEETISIINKLLLGLKVLEENGIVHKDIKPDNLIINQSKVNQTYNEGRSLHDKPTEKSLIVSPSSNVNAENKHNNDRSNSNNHESSFSVKIIDFELSDFCEDTENIKIPETNKLGNKLIVVGTPYFLSPEALFNNIFTPKSDIWACGIILHKMLYDKYPYSGSSIPDFAHNLFNQTVGKSNSQEKVKEVTKLKRSSNSTNYKQSEGNSDERQVSNQKDSFVKNLLDDMLEPV
eukprot:CAMPEP_0170530434 /NCGR_PEP_ID=MMETSP0209-20121228/47323_1 /TAXON_ID=665100 ORGANISM="Litonotus pictus, Strain P1" /NCGR_SAMPLE_ID=MMETSP0209 /ASSEMBLY_ACC=CAM_ASM_000301 /LENGTH=428 /DNA_ID=CAMNT_0010823539 /DNA_START=72 /DNA_END=1354 /DNA_ORIENTATION=-